MPIARSVSLRAQVEAESRTETLMGRDFLVIPVVALVEGVLQGMNSTGPELALEEEFGKVPEGWNGRPVVMNHPSIKGNAVSANSPAVLESFAFGQVFNTRAADGKLHCEAWLDVARAKELGGEFQDVIERINRGDTIEVSTGLFVNLEQAEGTFKGNSYQGIWRNIVPDHLAFLSEGVLGACSVEGGCGAPRVNSKGPWEFLRANCGGNCPCGCGGKGANTVPANNVTKDKDGKDLAFDPDRFFSAAMRGNTVPEGLLDMDVRKLLGLALKEDLNGYVYVVGFTANTVIYESYDPIAGSYITFQRTFDIGNDRKVTLGTDTKQVNLLVEIVPTDGSVRAVANQNKETEMSGTNNGVAPASGQAPTPKTNADGTPIVEPTTTATGTEPTAPAAAEAPAAPAAPTNNAEAPKVKTFKDLLQEAPEDVRDSIESGMRMHNARKESIIKALKETGRCKIPDDELKGMKLNRLEELLELAAVPSFEGLASPRTNAQDDDSVIEPPPALFAPKAA